MSLAPGPLAMQIWGENTFEYFAKQTNLCAVQKGTANWADVTEEEMKSLLGIHMAMGNMQLPSL
jgi:hypothetical protein